MKIIKAIFFNDDNHLLVKKMDKKTRLEHDSLKAEMNHVSNVYKEHLLKENYKPECYKWKGKFEELKTKLTNFKNRLDELRGPALKSLREDAARDARSEKDEEEISAEILYKAKNNSRFQMGVENSVDNWPRTYDYRTAGFIMQDGDMLDFSYDGSSRGMDHREITRDIDELESGTDGMRQFQHATGAIRLHAFGRGVSFDWVKKPTRKQQRVMEGISGKVSYIRIFDGNETYDFDEFWEAKEQFGWW